jgi:methylene-fatty-acyl-phospholipid synthase
MLEELPDSLEKLLYVSIVSPYLVYAFAYKFPSLFLKYLPASAFETIGLVFKVVSNLLQAVASLIAGLNYQGLVVGLPLIAIGQYFNYLVYQKLGKTRVYYGYEFGIVKGEFLTGFPFTMFHAQYKGCLLTVLGMFLVFNETRVLSIVTLLWMISYFFIIWIEEGQPGKLSCCK